MNQTRRDTAQQVCTPKELDAWRLHEQGLGWKSIALALDISISRARDRVWNANRKIALANRKETAA